MSGIKQRMLFLFFILGLWGSASVAGSILMVGLDKEGKEMIMDVPVKNYKDNLKKAIAGVQISTLPVLQRKSESLKGWMLRSVVVGLGVNLEVGIGEAKLGVLPRFRVGFSNAKEPSVP